MRFAAFTLCAFGAALLGHLIWWRAGVPRRQLPALVKCFASAFVVASLIAFVAGIARDEAGLPQSLHAALLYWALASTYIITYSSYLEVDSPTLTLMRRLGREPGGLAVEQAERLIASRPFLTARLEALRRDGLVMERDGKFVRTGKPALLFRMFQLWGRVLNVAQRNG